MKLSANNSFLTFPALPQGKVTCGIIAGNCPEKITDALKKYGVRLIKTSADENLDEPVKYHPDMLFYPCTKGEIILAPSQYEQKLILEKMGFEAEFSKPLKRKYPHDIALNFLALGGYIFGRTDFADPLVLKNAIEQKAEPIKVNQGYARCSVLIVSEKAAITEDESLFKALTEKGFDVLKLERGYVTLEGYDCGFIGGAGGKISKDTVAFFGDCSLHPQWSEIETFLSKYKCKSVFLDRESLADYGGFVPLLCSDI